jgi:hypothetical protein
VDPEAIKRKLRASRAASASWQCTCGAAGAPELRPRVTHEPTCRYLVHLAAAARGGESTYRRQGAAHFRRLRLMQVLQRAARDGKGGCAEGIYRKGDTL